ncbi:MAG TPA: sugar phosphate nucleotidyltransferase [Candidatus Anammoximicrobium sp.]|nr:sugar phosphate nucleotidyltransferase [Candidatus Anammoximicrobium sp.]
MLHAVIMAGGTGTRFWPASRVARPKQLLHLTGERTMIQATVDRLDGLIPPERTLVVTSRLLVNAIAGQLPQVPASGVIGEPCKRDTAPCIGLASALIERQDSDAITVVMPADQVIAPVELFQQAITHAVKLVEQQPERIVTFGIRPTYPAEVFGYIKRGTPLPSSATEGEMIPPNAFAVHEFREKPSAEVAAQYLDAGDCYWNSGIFVWRAATILSALKKAEPDMHARVVRIARAVGTDDYEAVFAHEFAAIQPKAIDYAVMERYQPTVVIEASFEWDDLGSWQSLGRLRGIDADGNTIIGCHVGFRTKGSIVRSDAQHMLVTVGVNDLIIVHTPDATLVANKHDEEAIRQVVALLREKGWDQYL